MAHSVCGLGYGNLGNLEKAEMHLKSYLELENKNGNRDKLAKATAQLSSLYRRKGEIVEAMRMCQEAKGMSIASRSLPLAEEFECLKSWGRFQEALETLELIRNAQQFPNPSAKKRMSAVCDANEAPILLELSRPEEALLLNESALRILKNDTKLTLLFTANQVWILAQLGRKEEALSLAEYVEVGLKEFADAVGVQKSCLNSLGRAFIELHNYPKSLEYWLRLKDFPIDPVSMPTNFYYQGICLEKMRESEKSQTLFKQAVDLNIDTHDAKLARIQLNLNSNPTAKG